MFVTKIRRSKSTGSLRNNSALSRRIILSYMGIYVNKWGNDTVILPNMDKTQCLSKSTESLRNNTSDVRVLIWSNFTKTQCLNYLNLIDMESKNMCDNVMPRIKSIFKAYKEVILNNIDNYDLTELSCLVRKLLNVSKTLKIHLYVDTSYRLYYRILYCLFDRGLKDSSLLLTIWKTLCISEELKIAVFSGLIGQCTRKSVKLLEYIIKNALNERFDFWGAWTKNHKLDSFPFCPVTAALLSGNEEPMKVLLKYGFEPNSQRKVTYNKDYEFHGNNVFDWLKRPLMENTSSRKKIITEVLLFLAEIGVSRSRIKRISMVNCFNLLWDVIPTPYVTKTELQAEIQERFLFPPYCNDLSFFPSTEWDFLRLCEFYKIAILKDDEEPLQPRSLKHLCKCTIRGEMQKSWNLPMGINNLPLPNHLKEYLHVSLQRNF